MTLAKRIAVEGSGLCYLAVAGASNRAAPASDASTRAASSLLGACYLSGSVFRIELDRDGLPMERISYFVHPREEPAAVTHAHCLVPDPDRRFAVAADLGLDRLFVYPLDRPGLEPLEAATVQLPKGEGPRHLVFHPRLPMAYLSTEYGNRVYAFRYDGGAGRLEPVQALSALPAGTTMQSYCADVRLSSDSSILLVSNRGHDSIALFRIGADGLLEALGHQPTFGSWPRGFALVDGDRFLVVANQKSGELVSIRFDPERPEAQPISCLSIPAPTWVASA